MHILITGATKGIGRALVDIFASKHHDLSIIARTSKDLEALKAELLGSFPNIKVNTYAIDLAKPESTHQLKEAFTSVEVLINNAGIFNQQPFLEEPPGLLEEIMQVNVFSAYHLCRAVIPGMLSRKQGFIFNIASVAAHQAYPNSAAYVMSKHALLGMSRSLRLAYRDKGIRVSTISPGATLTNSWAGVPIPPERLIDPQEIAKVVMSAFELGPSAIIEDVIIRPALGDL